MFKKPFSGTSLSVGGALRLHPEMAVGVGDIGSPQITSESTVDASDNSAEGISLGMPLRL